MYMHETVLVACPKVIDSRHSYVPRKPKCHYLLKPFVQNFQTIFRVLLFNIIAYPLNHSPKHTSYRNPILTCVGPPTYFILNLGMFDAYSLSAVLETHCQHQYLNT